MPRLRSAPTSALRERLADDIERYHLHIGERFAALGDSSYLREGRQRLATLAAAKPLQIEAWKLAAALGDLGDLAAAEQIERDTAAMYVVAADGTWEKTR